MPSTYLRPSVPPFETARKSFRPRVATHLVETHHGFVARTSTYAALPAASYVYSSGGGDECGEDIAVGGWYVRTNGGGDFAVGG